jgi:predicted PurR-regulated permease PerM
LSRTPRQQTRQPSRSPVVEKLDGDDTPEPNISQQIEQDISAYLVTITVMNAAVGVATAAAMYLCRLGDPLLWGAAAFLLN